MSAVHGLAWRVRLAVGGRSLAYLRDLRRWSRRDAEAVKQMQRARLEALLRHAAANVPYYRDVLSASGVVDATGVHLERFSAVPLLDKTILRERFDDLTSQDAGGRGTYVNTSGGSTGEPVRFVQDKASHDWKVAVKMLFDEWVGTGPGDRRLLLWGSSRDLSGDRPSVRERLSLLVRNQLEFGAFAMSDETMQRYAERYRAFRPLHVLAYAQSLFQWATFLERNDIRLPAPRAIMTSATNLEPAMRTTIERVFRAPVYDRYGSREVGDIACETGDGEGLVVSALTHVVEVLREDGSPAAPGEVGEVVVTLLTNYAMPLVRYRIGDAGALAAEPTGAIAWPRLERILGRVTDVFYTQAGKQVYGGAFTRLFYGLAWVAQFQVVQRAYDAIEIRIVPQTPGAEQDQRDDLDEVTRQVKRLMGTSCRVDFEVVDHIPVGPSGKRRYTLSEVGPPQAARSAR